MNYKHLRTIKKSYTQHFAVNDYIFFLISLNKFSSGWPKWKQRFEIFVLATGKDAADKVKVALLLSILGEACLDIYNTFDATKTTKLEDVLSCFDDHFLPKQNFSMETFKFNNIQQKIGQNVDSFLTGLKKQAANCFFVCEKDNCKTSYAERMIKDRMVLGVSDKNVQRHLLREPTMTLDKMQEYCRTIEVTMKHVQLLNGPEETQEINAIKYRKKYTNPTPDTMFYFVY